MIGIKVNPFDFLNSINYSKENLIENEQDEKEYNAFMVNRGLSYFQDTILIANEMNTNPHLDSKLQYDFLINMIRKRKRFSKWLKPTIESDIEAIKEYYGYSNDKAQQVLAILSTERITKIKEKVNKGGRSRK